jgi:hypothetical protein
MAARYGRQERRLPERMTKKHAVIRLLEMVARFRPDARMARLAERIADRCQAAVWERICRRAPGMAVAEARGYIRARAAAVVHAEVESALAEQPVIARAWRSRLVEMVTEEVVRAALATLFRMEHRPAAMRRAA